MSVGHSAPKQRGSNSQFNLPSANQSTGVGKAEHDSGSPLILMLF